MIHIRRNLLAPQWMLLYGLIVWGVMWLLSPIDYNVENSVPAVLLLGGYIGAFIVGTMMLKRNVEPKNGFEDHPPRNLRIAFTVLMALGFLGLFLRYFDLFFVKSYLSFESAAEYKKDAIVGDASTQDKGILGIVSAFFYPLSLISFIAALFYRKHLHKWQFVAACLGLVPFVAYSVLISARSPLVSALVMSAVAWVAGQGRDGVKVRLASGRFLRAAALIGFALFGMFFYSITLLMDRAQALGVETETAMTLFEETRDVEIKPDVREVIFSKSPLAPAATTAASLSFYYVHGFYQFQELFRYVENRPLNYGRTQFHFFARVLGSPGLGAREGEDAPFPTLGLFYTFFGNVLVDFGIGGGLIYCFLFGMLCQYAWNRLQDGKLFWRLLYPLLASIIFHMPVVDMFAGGAGTFNFIGIVFASMWLVFASNLKLGQARRPDALPA